MMRTKPLWVLLALLLVPAFAQGQSRATWEGCTQFEWAYPYACEDLGLFRVYLSKTSGHYAFGKAFYEAPGGYVAHQEAVTSKITFIPCEHVTLLEPGRYYAVATAVSVDLTKESKPSNEISFTYGDPSRVGAGSEPNRIEPVVGRPVEEVTLPEPPQRARGGSTLPEASRPKMPQGGRGGGSFSQHCLWRGGRDC